jgi:hypothetical protein
MIQKKHSEAQEAIKKDPKIKELANKFAAK